MKFEYCIETFVDAAGVHNPSPHHWQIAERLNLLGADGWMLAPQGLPGALLLIREARSERQARPE